MALRVLLADESSTIKKAIQMALSEYSVEVKSVQSGLDVLSVAHTFKPDLILADVLLTKKNGYEVCAELKKDPGTRGIPVILMWSSFLQLDRSQATKVKADATLEKPFDTETLQGLVEKYVSKLSNFPLKGLLSHGRLPDFTESETFIRQKKSYLGDSVDHSSDNTHSELPDDPNEDFKYSPEDEFSFQKPRSTVPPADDRITPEKEDWESSSNDQFVLETENFGDFEEVTVINSKQNSATPDLNKRIQAEINSYVEDSPLAKSKITENYASQSKGNTSFDEKLLKEEIKQMAERICWQIIPDITEKIVREELNKLLQGLEKNT